LGRSLEADITLPEEPSLSRQHIRIELVDGRYTLVDLDSANGTRLNGRDVAGAIPLSDGDVVMCGALEFRFELAPSVGAQSRPDGSSAATVIRSIAPEEGRPALASGEKSGGRGRRDSRVPPTIPSERRGVRPTQRAVRPSASRAEAPMPLQTALGAVPLFRALSSELLAAVAGSMSEQRYTAGQEIVRQGEDGQALYVVLAGQARVERGGGAGEAVELAMLGPGGFFGEMSVLDGQPRSATVRAVGEVRCALLPRWAIERAIQAHPTMALQMLAVLSMRLRAVERMITA
jgi:CRP/FNR family cyclic AMP-dependent transcriptional regulator